MSRTLLSIRVDLGNAMIWMVSILSDFQSFKSFLRAPKDRSEASTTVGMTLTFMFYSFFFSYLAKSMSTFSLSFILLLLFFSLSGPPNSKIHKTANSLSLSPSFF